MPKTAKYKTDVGASTQVWKGLTEGDWWKPKGSEDGNRWVTNYIRILPPHPEMQGLFYTPSWMHFGVGGQSGVNLACPRLFSRRCPVCDVGNEIGNRGKQDEARSYWASKQGLLNVVPVSKDGVPLEDPPRVRVWAASKTTMDELLSLMEEFGDFTDLEAGRVVNIRRKGTGPQNTKYAVELADDETEFDYPDLIEQIKDLTQVNQIVSYEEMAAALSGGNEDAFSGGPPAPAARRISSPNRTTTQEPVEAEYQEVLPEEEEEEGEPEPEPKAAPPARRAPRARASRPTEPEPEPSDGDGSDARAHLRALVDAQKANAK